MGKIIRFFKECIAELKKVVWPSRNDAVSSVKVVLISTVLIAVVLGLLDLVFVTGMNEGIFPHENSLEVDDLIEEERRAMYVACTRPMEKLYLTSYRENRDRSFKESRFISEIPNEYISKLKVK